MCSDHEAIASDGRIVILHGDCLEKLKELADNSVDSIITDPPYGLSFMGKKWDYEVPSEDIWREALRVLKPGGHLLAFFGTRTYHRGVVRIEDAGFEIRDQVMWIYGSGFPKSLDVSKAIDKAAGAEHLREISHRNPSKRPNAYVGEGGWQTPQRPEFKTKPATEAAKQWQGWGTALKPANEPIVVARKPLEGTVAQNVQNWGCGGLNIEASRISVSEDEPNKRQATGEEGGADSMFGVGNSTRGATLTHGRWPANILFDEEAAAVLDEQSGVLKSGGDGTTKDKAEGANCYGVYSQRIGGKRGPDSGGASRFFKVFAQENCDTSAMCKKTANTAKTLSSQLSLFEDFVLNLAVTSGALEGESSRNTIFLSTLGMLSELRQIESTNITTMQNIVEKFLLELQQENTSHNSRANTAEIQKLIATITTIQNLLKSNSFVEAVTSSSTSMSLELGAKDCVSRFAYVAKASKAERNRGLEGMPTQVLATSTGQTRPNKPARLGADPHALQEPVANHHPTVKPIKLMEYLVRMVTPPGGTVLDPFAGSGTTGIAAKKLGFKFIGIEREKEYVEIAQKRIASL